MITAASSLDDDDGDRGSGRRPAWTMTMVAEGVLARAWMITAASGLHDDEGAVHVGLRRRQGCGRRRAWATTRAQSASGLDDDEGAGAVGVGLRRRRGHGRCQGLGRARARSASGAWSCRRRYPPNPYISQAFYFPRKGNVSQVMTLCTTTGLDWSDERPEVIAMECP
ncbi:hypothetical protein Taro_012743 [Colocasia esculenta]|uniref:Uncharacterized protein n=1 Tax=Colocasia esculenta TaxID=4460 RepID=A0A843UED8_COLES|nr:hypothetical protein [Colocasia esculenta]